MEDRFVPGDACGRLLAFAGSLRGWALNVGVGRVLAARRQHRTVVLEALVRRLGGLLGLHGFLVVRGFADPNSQGGTSPRQYGSQLAAVRGGGDRL